MATLTVYGIKNCDTMKKTFTFLESENIAYNFYDYKKCGADETVLKAAFDQHGWEQVINRKGTSWRKLPEHIRDEMTADGAMENAIANPSLIKRPLIVGNNNKIILGFDSATIRSII